MVTSPGTSDGVNPPLEASSGHQRVPNQLMGSHLGRRAVGMPAQPDQFRFRRAAFYSGLKSKVGFILDRESSRSACQHARRQLPVSNLRPHALVEADSFRALVEILSPFRSSWKHSTFMREIITPLSANKYYYYYFCCFSLYYFVVTTRTFV
jgi:hypothetical protein